MADHLQYPFNPPPPFPIIPIPPSFPFHHYHPLMPAAAAAVPSKPLDPYAYPFLSPPPLAASPLMYRNMYFPLPSTPYFFHFHTFPAFRYYSAFPPMISPPCAAAESLGHGGAAAAHSNNVFRRDCSRLKREFVVSCGPRRVVKSSPKWVQKKPGGGGAVGHGGDDPLPKQGHCSGITTVMIKNIPNQFKRRDLLQLLDRYCQVMNQQRDSGPDFCVSEYDFVYLPMDFRRSWFQGTVSNLGYAFVNFTTSIAASKFCAFYRNHKWDVNVNKKICEITDARIQGKEALTNAFKNKIFWCRTDQYLPVMLSPASNGHRRYRRVNVGRRIPNVPRKPLRKCVV